MLRDHHGSGKYYCSPGPESLDQVGKKVEVMWGRGCIVLVADLLLCP